MAPVERNNTVEMAELLDKAVVAKADAIFGVELAKAIIDKAGDTENYEVIYLNNSQSVQSFV